MSLVERATASYERAVAQMSSGEDREGQRQMMRAVAQAFSNHQNLMVEAGTGTGKSLAYLIPSIESGDQTIVATATKALQDQLVTSDLPLAAAAVDRDVSWQLVKGRSNYACLAKVDDLGEFIESDIRAVADWADVTETGELSEIEPELPSRLASLVSARAEECPGSSACRRGDDCFSEAARIRAEGADVVVVNHHLLLADLRMRSWGASILPEVAQVVIDEAHRFEDAAIGTFGVELFPGRVRYAARLARGLIAESSAPDEIEKAADRAFDGLPGGRATTLAGGTRAKAVDGLVALMQRTARLKSDLEGVPLEGPQRERRIRLQRVLSSLDDDIGRIIDPGEGEVVWSESSEVGPRIRLAPLDIAPAIAEGLLARATTVFTSATLKAVGGFDRAAGRLGLVREREFDDEDAAFEALEVASPFDFASQSLLYCASNMPDPRAEAFKPAVRREIKRLIEASDGGALCLFTSWQGMTDAYEGLLDELDYPLFRQGDASPRRLLADFVDQAPAVLFATITFWQGVDIPGDPLRLVVIDKIPFSPPDDPLVKARGDDLRTRKRDPFREDALPRAGLILKQGVGRLIRTVSDRGVVAVLDRRLATTAYGKELASCLPPMRRTTEFSEVSSFFST